MRRAARPGARRRPYDRLHAVDPLQDVPEEDAWSSWPTLPAGTGVLVVRSVPGRARFAARRAEVTRLGRHPESEIFLDDITVSRRHADIEAADGGFACATPAA